MIALRVVRYAQAPPTPWKNGLGVTTELAIHPPGATLDAFDWRVSIARLDHTAAFSLFPGIERCLTVLEGDMTLLSANAAPIALTPNSLPVRFSGDVACTGVVVRGPVFDLNIMYRAPQWSVTVQRLRFNSGEFAVSISSECLLCSLADALQLQIAGLTVNLGRYDLLSTTERCAARIAVPASRHADACLIQLHRS